MRSIEVEGNTVEAAVELALAALGISRDDANIEVLSDQGQRARVKVSIAGGEPEEAPKGVDVSRETFKQPSRGQSVPAVTPDEAFPGKQSVVETLQKILEHLGISPKVRVPSGVTEEGFVIEVSGDGAALLIGRHGQVLEATEYLLNRVAFSGGGPAPRVQVDVEGYRERREASLQEMARRTADSVRQSGRPVVLQPMSPRDRRVVHVVLQDDPSVATHSEGDGPFRTLVVTPAGHRRT